MQKTIKEWLEMLPSPYKEEYIANIKKMEKLDFICSEDSFISSGFVWTESPQGQTYWHNLQRNISFGIIKLNEFCIYSIFN